MSTATTRDTPGSFIVTPINYDMNVTSTKLSCEMD